jgi:RHS repeat-associated protein
MLMKIWTGSLLFLLFASFVALMVAVAHEKDIHPFRDVVRLFKGQSWVGRILLGVFAFGMWVYASVKPGDGGGSGGGGDGGTNNVPQMVPGPGVGNLQPMNLPGGEIHGVQGQAQFNPDLHPANQPLGGGATLNLTGFEPITSTNTTHTIEAADFERGFVMTRIGTDEEFDFTPPPNATIVNDWRAFGAATDWIYAAFTNWTFKVATNDVSRLRIYSFGKIEPLIREVNGAIATNNWFAPFIASLGIVPQANWNLLDESDRPSQVWYVITPEGSLLITWQNALLDRDTGKPISFQIEFKTDGQFIYRYDLSRLDVDSVTNILAGASFAGNTWATNSLPTNVTSMAFYPLSEEDILNQDRDGDGLRLIDELFVYGTDPMLWDSDFDGLPDGVEVANGTNPAGRDSDNDGLVDGSDPDPASATPLDDLDGDGVPDAYESHWFGDTNVVDSTDAFGANGFNVGFELASGINPTNGAEAVFMSTNRIAAWKITDGFVAQSPTVASNIYERTFRIARNGGWEQFFLSSKPNRAGGWRLEGLALDWEDSEGESGTQTASPAGDSFYLPVSTNSPANLTIRLRQTATTMSCRSPLYLLAYSPNVEVENAQRVTTSNGVWTVAEIKQEGPVPVSIDRSERPCKAALYPQETTAELSTDDGRLQFQGNGTLRVNAPGVYPIPTMDFSAYAQPVLRGRLRLASPSPSATNNCYLAFLAPCVSYGEGHHGGGGGLAYDWWSGGYSETYEYPLDSGCLWREWHSDSSGGYVCNCAPDLSVGFDFSGYADISTNLVVNGETVTGTIYIGDVEVWSGTATHDVSTEAGSGPELLSDNGCDECSGCEEGNCDSLEGGGLGSLKFRIPLGVPRKGQISGFAWFLTKEPLTIGVDTLQVLSRDDAQVSETSVGGVRTIVCGDNRGRTLSIQPVANGIEVTITETDSGKLEHTWRILNVNGSASRIRLWKISRLNNTMSDETYIYDDGDWTKFDNISQTSEELVATGDINEDGYKREERILRDADNAVLSHTITESRRFGSFANAVLRQTYYAEKSWGDDNWNESFASYYTDNENPKRNGNVRLERGNARAWRFSAYDADGRTILTLDQHDGSGCPEWPLDYMDADAFDSQDIVQWLGNQWFTAVATVYDYTPLAGDDAASADADKVRTEARYLIEDGTVTLIGRTWTRYTHGAANGYATVTVETTTAGAQDATIADVRNAHRTETCYDGDAPGIPRLLRGATVTSTDEDGITTAYDYTIASGVLTTTERKSKGGIEAPTRSVSERCTTYGNVLREWSVHTASGIAFDEKRHLYDGKNRLRSTVYSDGSFTTNAYSCCRLLWSQDRTGRKVLRSAVTGEDHLYYAMEEVSLGQLPNANGNTPGYAPYENYATGDNHYRVTQHFMDALGRETNTVVRTCKTQGAATNNDWYCSGWQTSETTAYPYGVSDYEVSTDIRGNETTTIRYAYSDSEEVETIETNKNTVSTTYRNGATILYEEWPDGKWKETLQTSSYGANGCRIDTTTITASDHDEVTARTVYRDFLGRMVREVRPTMDVAYTYDGASSRVLSAADSISGETTTRLYNDIGEPIGQTKNGIVSRSDSGYEVESNDLWRVSSQTVSGSITNLCAVTKERLTGLSNELRGETVTYLNGTISLHSHTSFDSTNGVMTEVSESTASGTTTTKSKFGIAFETTKPGGTTSCFFDPYGRVFYTEKDGRSVDWIGRNDFGDVVEYDTFHSEGNSYYAEFYGYDSFGNRIAATNALGAVTSSAYDAANRLSESSGSVYPVRYGYDTEGRRTGLSTTRNGNAWDATGWTFDPATGFCTVKTYADGSTVTYSYTTDGKPLRTTYAGGRWRENAYNAKRELVSTEYSDGEVCAFAYDEFSHEIAASNDVAAVLLVRNDYGQVTNEATTVGAESRTIDRQFDALGRMTVCDESDYVYSPDGQIASISNAIASVEYSYTADRLDAGYALTLSNGLVLARSLTRDAYRRSLVTGIDNSVNNNVGESFSYAYDALNRPISRNADSFGYNDRSEVTNAIVSGQAEFHAYDEIGNSVWGGTTSNGYSYVSNSRNQYSEVLYASDWGCPSDPVASAYDADGNMTQFGEWTYTYDAANRLKTVSTNGVLALTNFYDAKSRRVKKVTPEATTTFFYDDWNLIEERVANTNGTSSTIRYYWGKDISGTLQGAGGVGGLLYLTVDGAVYVPFYDNIGNVTRYVDGNGNTVAQYTYDAFGKLIAKSGPLADFFRHRFSTKYFDIESGLYYYGYRFYHPVLMRWLNRDPIEEEGGLNLYATCANALIISFDILGKDDGTVIVEGLGAGWAGARVTLKGKTAVRLNNELYYLTMTKPIGTRNPLGGSSTSLFLFKDGNPKRALRIDYHKFPLNSPDPPYWHVNVDGGGIARVANSSKLNHTTSAKIRGTGRMLTVFKHGDKICFIAGVAMSAIDIYKAENRVRETARQVGGWSAAYAGGRIGSAVGAKAGMATAIALGQAGPQVATPEEVVTVPVFGVIGGIGGGIVGGIGGFILGSTVTEKVYDWAFTPLTKEEWEVGCEKE